MDEGGRERVKELLTRAAALPAERRAAFVAAQAADAAVAREALALLPTLEDSGFMQAPTVGRPPALDPPPTAVPATLGELPGAIIGRYKLLQQIGEGGFGTVFMAEQTEPVVRRVALKIIKLGMDTRQVIARFEAERQALALMDHPHIARVLDGGATESGRPYFVMELVRGEPVTHYCDRAQCSIEQRLDLFQSICRAVQHAHQKGIIHRDLKPSNVLVTVADGRPLAKVIDFGIAKATAVKLTDKTFFTEMNQLIGTPEYMSPEQAEVSGVDIDTRSDVYALGVLLYELLAGGTPFDGRRLRRAPLAEIQRIIRDEEPPRPSVRVGTSGTVGRWERSKGRSGASSDRSHVPALPLSHADQGSSLIDIARCRRSEPQALTRALRGDLDWIVMKCLEKDRARRYETAAALADDVGRFLHHEPVAATPPSAGYKLRKFVQRHRTGVAAGVAVVLALALGLGAALYGLQSARTERDAARIAQLGEQQQRRTAERVAEFMAAMLAGAGPEVAAGRDATMLRGFLDQSLTKLAQGELRDAPEAEADLRITISNVYREIGDPNRAAAALEPVEALLAGPLREHDRLQDRGLESRALLLSARGRHDESIAISRRLVDLRRRMFGETHTHVARALAAVGAEQVSRGRLREALDTLREALGIAQASGDELTLANVLTNMADPLGQLGMHGEALEAAEEALAHARRAYADDHPNVAEAINNVAAAASRTPGQEARALELVRESIAMKRRLYPDGHARLGVSLANLAFALQEQGRLAEADPIYVEALDMLRRFQPATDEDVVMALVNFSTLAGRRGDLARKESLAREALPLCRRLYPTGHVHTAFALVNIGASLLDQRPARDGLSELVEAADILRRLAGPADAQLAEVLGRVGSVLIERGRFDDAIPPLREALSIRRQAQADEPAGRAAALAQLAAALLGTDTLDGVREAGALANECLDLRRRVLRPDDWRLANTQSLAAGAIAAQAALDVAAASDERLAALRAAEPLLLTSYGQLEAARERIPNAIRARVLSDAAGRTARLYGVWAELDPAEAASRQQATTEWDARVAATRQAPN